MSESSVLFQACPYRPADHHEFTNNPCPTEMDLIDPNQPGVIRAQARRVGITGPFRNPDLAVYRIILGFQSNNPGHVLPLLFVYDEGELVPLPVWNDAHPANEHAKLEMMDQELDKKKGR